ncbi:S4 domain-containing protein YaaA [Soehngenia saccharolytica]|jgi:ribosome-associated protein|nr:S4 domain-containing protein YaaA [Soehngenia saccharolytica]
MEKINIQTEYIKLEQLLKLAGITQTGGEAKLMIKDGLVKVNGEVCTQRGKKLRTDDKIEVNGKTYVVV